MIQYHKIKTVWKRDPDNKYKTLLEGIWSKPEFEFLKDLIWTWTEKIDGTSLRTRYNCFYDEDPQLDTYLPLEFRGKQDKSQMQPILMARLPEIFSIESLNDVFGDQLNVCLYGEGFGKGIQKAGKKYIPDGVDFILFDIRVGRWWLLREDVEKIAEQLGIKVVPIVGEGTLTEAIDLVRNGFKSLISDQIAEGLIMIPKVPLFNRKGERIITKLKHKDFK